MKTPLLISLLCLTGCWFPVSPVLPPLAPGPFVPADQVLFSVPDDYLAATVSAEVLRHRDTRLPELATRQPLRAQQVRRHEIATGMTTQEVVWSFLSHPTRSEDHGPPGSHILMWDTAPFVTGRYWVRTDQWGKVASAGRY